MLLPTNRDRMFRTESTPLTGGNKMGMVYASLQLISSDDRALFRHGLLNESQVKSIQVSALVDSGAYMLVITEQIKLELDLPVLEERLATLADDTDVWVEVVGPVEIHFENRQTVCSAIVLPGAVEVLLGSIPMEDLDVLIDPRAQRLIVNPKSPDIPMTQIKQVLPGSYAHG